MTERAVTEKDVLTRLYTLNPERWFEVWDFICYLSQEVVPKPARISTLLSYEWVMPRGGHPLSLGWDTYALVADRVRQRWPEEHSTRDILDEIRR